MPLSPHFIEVAEEHWTIGKHGSNFAMSAQDFDLCNQRADTHVGTVLDYGNLAPVYAQRLTNLPLRHLTKFPEFIQWHRR